MEESVQMLLSNVYKWFRFSPLCNNWLFNVLDRTALRKKKKRHSPPPLIFFSSWNYLFSYYISPQISWDEVGNKWATEMLNGSLYDALNAYLL